MMKRLNRKPSRKTGKKPLRRKLPKKQHKAEESFAEPVRRDPTHVFLGVVGCLFVLLVVGLTRAGMKTGTPQQIVRVEPPRPKPVVVAGPSFVPGSPRVFKIHPSGATKIRWFAFEGAKKYRVTVSNENGEVLAEKETSATHSAIQDLNETLSSESAKQLWISIHVYDGHGDEIAIGEKRRLVFDSDVIRAPADAVNPEEEPADTED